MNVSDPPPAARVQQDHDFSRQPIDRSALVAARRTPLGQDLSGIAGEAPGASETVDRYGPG